MAEPKSSKGEPPRVHPAFLMLLADASASDRWAQTLERAASKAGFHLITGPAPETFAYEQKTVVVSNDVNWTLHIPSSNTHLFADGDLPPAPPAPGTFSDRHELHKLSRQLVVAAHVTDLGAPVYDRECVSADIDGLGRIEAPQASARLKLASPLAMFENLPPRVGVRANWPAQLFSFHTEAFFEGPSEIDLTGRARMLVHGPYLFLPRGRWKAEIRIAVDPEGGVAPLRIQWGKDGDFATLEARIDRAGQYSVDLERDWGEPGPAQVVVWATQAMFKGRLVFQGCDVERVAATVPELEISTLA